MTLVHTIGGIPNYPLIFPNHPLPLAPPSLRRPIKIWPNFKCQSFCATKKATFPKHGKYVGLSPCPVTVTTRIVVFLVGDPNLNLYLPLLLGGGTIQQICYHGDGRFIVLSIDLLQRGEEGRHQRLRVILLRVRNPVEILLLTNWDLTHKIISQQNIYTVHTYHQLLSVHSLFPSVPHMTYFQIGGPCWRICTSYTPNTTRDWLLTTTKGYLAHWMRERIQWDALRFFWCLKNMQGDASKCFHMTYQKYCFSATVCLSFFSAFTALASLIVCHLISQTKTQQMYCPHDFFFVWAFWLWQPFKLSINPGIFDAPNNLYQSWNPFPRTPYTNIQMDTVALGFQSFGHKMTTTFPEKVHRMWHTCEFLEAPYHKWFKYEKIIIYSTSCLSELLHCK